MRIDFIKLLTRMRQQDMNQKQLSVKSGVNPTTISNIVRGCACSDVTAGKIADALGVTVNDLRHNG